MFALLDSWESKEHPLHAFRCTILRFSLIAEGDGEFDTRRTPGDLLRGRFGAALKHNVCSTHPACQDDACILTDSCAYELFFKSKRAGSAVETRGRDPQRPYVFEPAPLVSPAFRRGDFLRFHLVLVGRGIGYYPIAISAVARMAVTRFGYGDGKWRLCEVESVASSWANTVLSKVYDGTNGAFVAPPVELGFSDAIEYSRRLNPKLVDISFQTEAYLRHQGQYITCLEIDDLLRALSVRLNGLLVQWCGANKGYESRRLLGEAASNVRMDAIEPGHGQSGKTAAVWGRYRLTGDLGPLLPLLVLGEHVHIGKSTAFGFGKYVCG